MNSSANLAWQLAQNQTAVDCPFDGGLVALFERQVENSPDHPAVVYEGEALSYAEFNRAVNRLAHLLQDLGCGRDGFVGLCLDRSIDMATAVWAVLKAGGAYVPLSVDDPELRLKGIIEDAGLRIILVDAKTAPRLGALAEHALVAGEAAPAGDFADDNLALDIAPGDLAYMIYTSGSTGRPKGTMVEQAAIHNRIVWMQDAYHLSASDRVLQKTPYTFDVSLWEFLWPLTSGATLVVARPGGHMSPNYLARTIREQGVTCLHFVPSMLRMFLRAKNLSGLGLRHVFCSGEALEPDVRDAFFERMEAELHNLYGPTEAAVDVSAWRCRPGDAAGIVPIGKPIANIQLFVLDDELRPVARGETGELCIGGIGLARGYLNRSQLTRESFIANPVPGAVGSRLYRTGDMACFLADGNLQFLGRRDHQVKISGQRIELGEIEVALRAHPDVADAVVVPKAKGADKVLIAFVKPGNNAALGFEDGLADWLRARLPAAMVPQSLRLVDGIPLTSSGKTDRKALLAND